MELKTMSLSLETGFKCKYCDNNIFGCYVWLNSKMYFHGKCQCSGWLVRSTHLKLIFNYNGIFFI